eukprot:890068-Pyramimonas_sp.AAC.1
MGRRGAHFAVGHGASAFDGFRSATSQSCHQVLLAVDGVTAGKMMQIKTNSTERWCSEVSDRLDVWNRVQRK